jgi:glutamine synthetase
VELRLPGGDANPYLTLTAALALGWHGLQQGLAPGPGDALPRTQTEALDALALSAVLRQALGARLCALYLAIKRHEQAERNALADPRRDWDLRYLIELA